MPATLDAQTTEAKARELLDRRIHSVRELVATRQALADLRAQTAQAEVADAKAYQAALADGWSPDELRKLGLSDPEHKPTQRRRHKPRANQGTDTTTAPTST